MLNKYTTYNEIYQEFSKIMVNSTRIVNHNCCIILSLVWNKEEEITINYYEDIKCAPNQHQYSR